METIAKLFTNGRSQAVRIPKACEFAGVEEVVIRKEGNALILLPVRKSWSPMPAKRLPWMTTSWRIVPT